MEEIWYDEEERFWTKEERIWIEKEFKENILLEESFYLRGRVAIALAKSNIKQPQDLLKYSQEQLKRLPRLGKKGFKKVDSYIRAAGYTFEKDECGEIRYVKKDNILNKQQSTQDSELNSSISINDIRIEMTRISVDPNYTTTEQLLNAMQDYINKAQNNTQASLEIHNNVRSRTIPNMPNK